MHLNISEWGYQFVPEVFRQFFAETWIQLVIFCIALIVIWVFGDKRAKAVLVYPILILVVTIYNPWLMKFVIEILGLEARYYRYLWMIPITLETAYALVLVCDKIKRWYLKAAVCLILAAALVLPGNSVIPQLTQAENLYKVNWEVIGISEVLREDCEEEEKTCLYIDTGLLALRSYDPSIRAVFTRSQYYGWSIDITDQKAVRRVIKKKPASYTLALVMRYGYQVKKKVFKECIQECEVDYLIPQNALGLDAYLTEMGYELIYNNGNHSIYRVNNEG